jgi:hypothetical protein
MFQPVVQFLIAAILCISDVKLQQFRYEAVYLACSFCLFFCFLTSKKFHYSMFSCPLYHRFANVNNEIRVVLVICLVRC